MEKNEQTICTALQAWLLLTQTPARADFTYKYQFGNGQLLNPVGVAVDGSGNVFVADTRNNRIEVFSQPQSVPEPSSLMMLGLGPLIAAGYGARRAAHSRSDIAPAGA